jgi:hypothetical protein
MINNLLQWSFTMDMATILYSGAAIVVLLAGLMFKVSLDTAGYRSRCR